MRSGIGWVVALALVVGCGGGSAGTSATTSTGGLTGGLTGGSAGGSTIGSTGGSTGVTGTGSPATLFGVTIDDTSKLEDTVAALKLLGRRPTARIVFDAGLHPVDYRDAVTQISAVSDVLAQPVDSSEVAKLSVSAYQARMAEYMDAFRGQASMWEIGNEVNGEWLGDSADVAAKIGVAYDEAKRRGLKTAVTLYFNSTCVVDPAHEMVVWTESNVPDRVKAGVDFVLVSYYPDDCAGSPDWPTTFATLARLFPSSAYGFGELGITDPARKESVVRSFYSMPAPVRKFVGGYFWWTFKEDATPTSQPLWNVFNALSRS